MKFSKIFLYLSILLALYSCGGEDDICTNGEATPRLKVQFRSEDGKAKTLDSLYVSAEYSEGKKTPVFQGKEVDSVLIALRVDDNQFTNIYIKTRNKGDESVVKLSYTTKSEYVSPACGIKRLYENLDATLVKKYPVLRVEKSQNEIINEYKPHVYLIF